MPAEVETMFYVRETPWHGLGVRLEEAPSSEEALKASGLDWEVIQVPIQFVYDGKEFPIPNRVANIRSTDLKVLGNVSTDYQVIQNKEAFAFTDALLGEGVVYETAGSLWGGARVWLLARLPNRYKTMGDDIEPYVCVNNSHNGQAGVDVILTPVRVVCQNTLNLALRTAKRRWSVWHTGDPRKRLDEARRTLDIAHRYYETFTEEAERLANIPVNYEEAVKKLLAPMENATPLQQKNAAARQTKLLELLQAPDIKQFENTAWGLLNGVSDFVGHVTNRQDKEAWKRAQLVKAFDGYPLLNEAYAMVMKAA